jgi:hypothetical protein
MNADADADMENLPEDGPESGALEKVETLTKSPEITSDQSDDPAGQVDPTRYGDWEKNGRCIDF